MLPQSFSKPARADRDVHENRKAFTTRACTCMHACDIRAKNEPACSRSSVGKAETHCRSHTPNKRAVMKQPRFVMPEQASRIYWVRPARGTHVDGRSNSMACISSTIKFACTDRPAGRRGSCEETWHSFQKAGCRDLQIDELHEQTRRSSRGPWKNGAREAKRTVRAVSRNAWPHGVRDVGYCCNGKGCELRARREAESKGALVSVDRRR